METEWVSRLQSVFFSRIKNEFSKDLKEEYDMTSNNFSTVRNNNSLAVFPFVSIEEIVTDEIGNDLEGTSVNGVRYGLEIRASDNKSQKNAKKVAYEVHRIMKTMRFNCKMPHLQPETNNVHTFAFVCSRVIGEGDIL